jgi:hypothetical protein
MLDWIDREIVGQEVKKGHDSVPRGAAAGPCFI